MDVKMDTKNDSKLYNLNDLVKAGCNDCSGCFSCCQGMGESIILDPYDIWMLEVHLDTTFAALMQDKIELHVEQGLILPNLKMQETSEMYGFLNKNGRCAIHGFHPGLCRLFPLGRKYENNEIGYFMLEDACIHTGRTKIKVKKWLDIADAKQYESFLVKWHNLRKELQEKTRDGSDEVIKDINMKFLHIFYEKQYEAEDFYRQFEERMNLFGQSLA